MHFIIIGRYAIRWLPPSPYPAPLFSSVTTLRGEQSWRVWRVSVTRYSRG